MPRIHIIATGGTIAMAHDDRAGGAIVALSGADFLHRLTSQSTVDLPSSPLRSTARCPAATLPSTTCGACVSE